MHGIPDKMQLAANEAGSLFHMDKELSALKAAEVMAILPAE